MKKVMIVLAMMAACLCVQSEGDALLLNEKILSTLPKQLELQHYATIYPACDQQLQVIERDSDGALMITLTDGSTWEIDLGSLKSDLDWLANDPVRVEFRKKPYFFGWTTRDQMSLYNVRLDESFDVYLWDSVSNPAPLTVMDVESNDLIFDKLLIPFFCPLTFDIPESFENAEVELRYDVKRRAFDWTSKEYKKILVLSDGTRWLIKDNYKYFQKGTEVYIAAPQKANENFEFVIIDGYNGSTLARREAFTQLYKMADWTEQLPIGLRKELVEEAIPAEEVPEVVEEAEEAETVDEVTEQVEEETPEIAEEPSVVDAEVDPTEEDIQELIEEVEELTEDTDESASGE